MSDIDTGDSSTTVAKLEKSHTFLTLPVNFYSYTSDTPVYVVKDNVEGSAPRSTAKTNRLVWG